MSGTNSMPDPQMAGVSRARRLSEQLMANAMNPQGVRAGASWSQIAPLLQAVAGSLGNYQADQREAAINSQRQDEVRQFSAGLMGSPSGAPEPMAPAQAPSAPAQATPLAGALAAPALVAPQAQAAPPNIYGRNQDLVARRDALLDADPVQLASASQANLPPGQPAYNPARPGANSELPGWDSGVAPPTGRVMPVGASGAPPSATPLATSLGASAAPTTPLASRLSVPTPERLMQAYQMASTSQNPQIRAQAPALLQMAQFGSLREDRTADNARNDRQFTFAQQQGAEANRRADAQLGISQAQLDLARNTGARANEPTVGLNPIYGQGPDGQPVIMLSDNRGNIRQPQLPEGVRPTLPTRDVNLGTSMLTLDRSGNPVASRDINIRGREAEERIGQQQGTDIAGAPQALRTADTSLGQIDAVLNHPALRTTTGLLSFTGAAPGTPNYGLAQRVEQLRGGAFLQAFNSMRGSGAITEAEGRKATDAIARLDRNQSTADFRASLEELRGIVSDARTRAASRAPAATAGMPGAQMPISGTGQGASPPDAGGPIAVNPQTGQRLRLQGGAWVPVQ